MLFWPWARTLRLLVFHNCKAPLQRCKADREGAVIEGRVPDSAGCAGELPAAHGWASAAKHRMCKCREAQEGRERSQSPHVLDSRFRGNDDRHDRGSPCTRRLRASRNGQSPVGLRSCYGSKRESKERGVEPERRDHGRGKAPRGIHTTRKELVRGRSDSGRPRCAVGELVLKHPLASMRTNGPNSLSAFAYGSRPPATYRLLNDLERHWLRVGIVLIQLPPKRGETDSQSACRRGLVPIALQDGFFDHHQLELQYPIFQ